VYFPVYNIIYFLKILNGMERAEKKQVIADFARDKKDT
jgi:hypothetical protein